MITVAAVQQPLKSYEEFIYVILRMSVMVRDMATSGGMVTSGGVATLDVVTSGGVAAQQPQ